ncbi:MAG: winged helix-turn-helix domain-containing protein [Syntrophobacteraceae bacterium]
MASDFVKLTVKSKVWIETEKGEVVFGAGRLKILNAVEKTGSINAAATELHMSYRAVWGKIRATEDRLGKQLLTKHAGGKRGGGSALTPFGKMLIERFRNLDGLIKTTSDTLFEGLFVSTMSERPEETGEEKS